ncbi:amino acid adenylation domain-containing protein [Kribbella antiqua]|uniref:Amino acid adenylation domain-containing protein n=1 Tax=Kribbella antiqua TaxID=2512217 RepID=A0A4R2J6R2_9ACTN|nr:non-ribosomal peptide synthetase/type I polyketide synthase [Kribbella antiqua]TCO52226.1 amino acid adenylation domain-containing protein [Kribbella antiqua]
MDRPAISTGPALMIPAGYPRDLPSALLRAARDFGGAGVVEIGPDGRETRLDFPTLLELAARILAGLRANGVRAGDPAVVHCTEPVGFFASFWACTLGGIRPLLMAPSPDGDRTEAGRERLRKVTDLLGWTVLIGRPSDLPNDLGLPVLDPDALAGHEPTSEFHRPAADDVAVLMMSSGTTGTPKIVQLTHRGLVEFAAGTPAMLPVRPGQTTLNWLPLDQSGAFLLYHLLPVFTGCTNIHVNTGWVLANPLRWLDLMDQHRVNHSWSPNFGYRLATQAIAGEPDRHWDLSALRSLVSGGEQITVPVMSEFLRVTNRFGVVPETFVAAWGMTETVTGITFARPGLTPNVHRVRIPPTGVIEWVDQRTTTGKVAVARPGKARAEAPGVLSLVSVGAPAPGTTVRIVAPNGAVLPEGRIGQLQIASARVTPGYLGNLEADRAAFPIGNWPARKWLATGDQGFITGGQVVITGRDSERIIMSGKLYYAHDIETVASTVVGAEHGLVAACGVADPETGTDRLVVFYALTPESIPGMDQAIRSLVRGRLGLDAEVVGVPRRDFPTTPGGKILRPLLKQRWIDGTLETPPHPYVEPAGASSYSGPAGEGPYDDPADTLISAERGAGPAVVSPEDDPAERTAELPVVRLAWQRTLQQSIPTPPERPTLGANRQTPPPTSDPLAPDALAPDAEQAGTADPEVVQQPGVAESGVLADFAPAQPEDAYFDSSAFSRKPTDELAGPEPHPAETGSAQPTPDDPDATTQLPALTPTRLARLDPPANPDPTAKPEPLEDPEPTANAEPLDEPEPTIERKPVVGAEAAEATAQPAAETDSQGEAQPEATEVEPPAEPASPAAAGLETAEPDHIANAAEVGEQEPESSPGSEPHAEPSATAEVDPDAIAESGVVADTESAPEDVAEAVEVAEGEPESTVGAEAPSGPAVTAEARAGAVVEPAVVGRPKPVTIGNAEGFIGQAPASTAATEEPPQPELVTDPDPEADSASEPESSTEPELAPEPADDDAEGAGLGDQPAAAAESLAEANAEPTDAAHPEAIADVQAEPTADVQAEPIGAVHGEATGDEESRADVVPTGDIVSGPAAEAQVADLEGATPESAEAAAAVVEPQPEPAAESEPPADLEPAGETVSAAAAEAESLAEPESAGEAESESAVEPSAEEDSRAELEQDGEVASEPTAEVELPADADPNPEAESESELAAEAVPKAEVEPETGAVAERERESDVVAEASLDADVEPEAGAEAAAVAVPEPEAVDEPDLTEEHPSAGDAEGLGEAGPQADAQAEAGVEAGAGAESEAELVAEAEPVAEDESESGTEAALVVEPEQESEPLAEVEPGAEVEPESETEVAAVAESGSETVDEPDLTAHGQLAADTGMAADAEALGDAGKTGASEPEADVEVVAGAEPDLIADGEDAELAADADAPGEAEPQAEAQPESGASETELVAEPMPDASVGPEAGAKTGVGAEAGVELVAEAESIADVEREAAVAGAEQEVVGEAGMAAAVGVAADGELSADSEAAADAEAQEPTADGRAEPELMAAGGSGAEGEPVGEARPGAVVELAVVPEAAPAHPEPAEPEPAEPELAQPESAEPAETEAAEAEFAEAPSAERVQAEVASGEVVPAAKVASAGEPEPAVAQAAEPAVVQAAEPAVVQAAESKTAPGKQRGKAKTVEPVAVVGLAGRFPGAETLEQFWDNLVGGVESIRRFTPDEVSQAGGHLDDDQIAVSGALDHVESFDAKYFGLSDREAELMDPAQRLFLEVCQQALEHGGYAGTASRVGVFAGSGMNLYAQQAQPRDSIATRVAYRLGLSGPAIGVQSAWSSSLVAVHLACQAIRSGDADLALAGAAAVQVPQATGYRPAPESILSPSGKVRAFDAEADGTVGGNGVAAVLLKRLDQAVADGDTVYAVIRGSAVSNEDAPAGNQVDLIERALERAGFAADSLSYIEANAIGSAAADSAEVKALTTALRRHTDKVGFCTIGSVKPNIGHLDSAAGMAGLIKTILMLQHRTLVPTINYTKPNSALKLADSPFVIGSDVREWEAGTTLRAGVSALDAGGTNAHVILEEAPRQIRRGDDGPVVLPLSAPDPDALADLVELFRTDLDHGTGHRLIDLAGTAALGRPAHRHRIAVAGSSEAELVDALGSAQATEVPRGGPGPLGYAFTGQGAARRGMAAGLAARFPVFRQVLDECDRVYAEEFGGSLNELLLTPAGSSEGVWPTETAQPALFAFELALARLWQSFGVQPALVVGHSVGEYAALCVAGALSLADGVRLTAKRGELMQRGTVPGAMVAVRADADRVRELAQTPGVEIAAGNGPQSFVLTGSSEVIVGQLAAQLDQLQVAWQRLDVDRAFHSSLVDPILADFAAIVSQITLKPLRTPMVSSWSGELLESGTVLDGDYLVGQLRQPVLFGDAVEAVTAAGCRRFLELGPDAVLSPAGRRIAPNSTWIPAQRLGQDPVLATMNGLAELFEQGTEIAWSKVYADGGRVPLPTYPFRRVHHPIDPSAVGTASRPATARVQANAFERAARAQAAAFEPSSAAVKRIPLDPPAEPETVEIEPEEVAERSPFALPAETHQVDADYLAQAGVLSGDEVSAERYRESLDAVLDLTCEELHLDPYDLTVDHTFAELGATPASMAPVIEQINARFTVELTPDDLFATHTTPHKLATAVAVQTPKAEAEEVAESIEAPEEPAVVEVSAPVAESTEEVAVEEEARDARSALAVLGSGLAELAAKVDEAAAATSVAELPGTGMAALMSQQLRVAGQLVDGVTKLMREQLALLNETAAAEEEHEAPQPEAPVDEEREQRRRDFEYWDLTLAGAEPLVLPADHARPAATDEVASIKQEFDAELGDAVFVYSRERKLSPLMTMLAAIGTVLGRFAAQDDVTIGSALIRPQGDTSTATQRPLPLRLDLSGEPDLGELAHRVRDITTGAFDHAGTDLAVLERDPLFQVLVEFEDGEQELPESLDLRLRLTHHGAGITCTADYRSGLFEQSTIERLLAYLEAVLRRATTQPHLRLPDLMLPIESDLETLRELEGEVDPTGPIGRVRRNAVVAGELSGLHTLFEQQVARTPDAIALVQGDRELTYAELDRRSNAVAWQLVDLGIKPGQLVAVRVARGTELVVAVLAVLKSGAAYLPLDPGVPESRWGFMVEDSNAVALVGDDAALADRLGLRLVPVAAGDGDARARQAPPVRAAADDVAFCIYTSGSTGNPKGVLVPHRGPVNLVRHYLQTRSSLRTLQWTSFGFDVHVQEMFTTLASGAALVLIGEDDRYDPDAVIAALRDHRVERLFMAFSPLTALLATMRRLPELPALREIVAGGEAMVLTHKVRDFLAAHPECRLFNEYGPVEASIVTTIHEVDPAEDRPSIGRPVDGVVVRLLDQALRPVPVGAVGEIHLGGAAVAQGYIGRPDETERMFVPDPGHPGGRLYRSRDLGRWRVDGTLEYLGRADDQVKIRGHRVEPGETEHVLADQPGVVDAVVIACADPAGDTCLLGYVVLEDSDPAVLARLMLDLGKELPIYLVPADLIPIEELPLDDNGRLDRARLPEPEWLKP